MPYTSNNKLIFTEQLRTGDDPQSLRANKEVALYFHDCLFENEKALRFITEKRKVPLSSIEKFLLGYCPYSHNVENIPHQLKGRIIIPVFDLYGEVVGLCGRVMGENSNSSKYYNTGFSRNHVLFNYHNAVDTIVKSGVCFLVEGYFDVISMVSHGVLNTIGLLGTGIDRLRACYLYRHCRVVLVIPDHDEAGMISFQKIKKVLSQDPFCLPVKLVGYPKRYKDIDSFIVEGPPKDVRSFCEIARSLTFKNIQYSSIGFSSLVKKCNSIKTKIEHIKNTGVIKNGYTL